MDDALGVGVGARGQAAVGCVGVRVGVPPRLREDTM